MLVARETTEVNDSIKIELDSKRTEVSVNQCWSAKKTGGSTGTGTEFGQSFQDKMHLSRKKH